MENKNYAKIVCSMVVGGLLLTSGGMAIAGNTTATSSGTAATKPIFIKQNMMPGDKGGIRQGNIEQVLQEQVSNSVITQEQADQLLALQQKQNEERKEQQDKFKSMTEEERQAQKEEMKTQREKFKNMTEDERQALIAEKKEKKPGLFDEAVSQGIITQEQADIINEALRSRVQEKQQANPEVKLDSLVEQGTITSQQVEAIIKKMEENTEQRKANLDKMKELTKEERQQLAQEKKEKPDLLGSLVADGTLTQEQADAVNKMLAPQRHGNKGMEKGNDSSQ